MTFLDIVVNVMAMAIWIIQFTLHYGLLAFQYLLLNYPQATSFLVGLVLVYLAYRLVIRLIRFWYGMVIATVKTMLFLSFIFVCLAIYLRGWNFFQHDLPFLKDSILELINDFASAKPKYLKILFQKLQNFAFDQFFNKKALSSHKFNSAKYTNDYGIDIDESYFDYVDQHFNAGEFDYDKLRDFVTDNLDNVDHYLRDQGIDLEQIGQNIANGFVNQYGRN